MDGFTEYIVESTETVVSCSHCGAYPKENEQKYVIKNGQLETFCSKQCLILKESEVQSCRRCKAKKYDFDMIKITRNGKCYYYCSSFCMDKNRKTRSMEIENLPDHFEGEEPWEDDPLDLESRKLKSIEIKNESINISDSFLSGESMGEESWEDPLNLENSRISEETEFKNEAYSFSDDQYENDDPWEDPGDVESSRSPERIEIKNEPDPLSFDQDEQLEEDDPLEIDNERREKEKTATEELIKRVQSMQLRTQINKSSAAFTQTESVEIQTEDVEYSHKNEQSDKFFIDGFPVAFPVYVPTPVTTIPLYNPVPLIIPIFVPCPVFFPLINPENVKDEMKSTTSDAEDGASDTEMDAAESGLPDDMYDGAYNPDMNYLDCLLEELTKDDIIPPPAAPPPRNNIEENCMDILNALKSIKKHDKLLIDEESFNSNLHSLDVSHGLSLWNNWIALKKADGSISAEILYENLNHWHISATEINTYLTLLMNDFTKPDAIFYEPNAIYYLCLCMQKHLSDNEFQHSIFLDNIFETFSDSLNAILQEHSEQNNSADTIPSNFCSVKINEEMLWESQQLGNSSPSVLLFTIFYMNTKYLKIKTVHDHMLISFRRFIKSSASTKQDDGTIVKVKSFNFVPQFGTKLCKPFQRNVCAIKENKEMPDRCPVKLSEFYISKCPIRAISGAGGFYLLPEEHCIVESPKWYTTELMSTAALEKMLNRCLVVEDIKEALWNYY